MNEFIQTEWLNDCNLKSKRRVMRSLIAPRMRETEEELYDKE